MVQSVIASTDVCEDVQNLFVLKNCKREENGVTGFAMLDTCASTDLGTDDPVGVLDPPVEVLTGSSSLMRRLGRSRLRTATCAVIYNKGKSIHQEIFTLWFYQTLLQVPKLCKR